MGTQFTLAGLMSVKGEYVAFYDFLARQRRSGTIDSVTSTLILARHRMLRISSGLDDDLQSDATDAVLKQYLADAKAILQDRRPELYEEFQSRGSQNQK